MSPSQILATVWWLPIIFLCFAHAEVLIPPLFNIAENRRIVASATCGDQGPELYCRLKSTSSSVQICDICKPDDGYTMRAHSPRLVMEKSDGWWQSPPLSRGLQYQQVNLTMDLGQEFQVTYIFITMANSPRPGVWAVDRTTDLGNSWHVWQYFAENLEQCEEYFGTTNQNITHDNSVICDTSFSKLMPLEGGEMIVRVIAGRPSAEDIFSSPTLQQWSRASGIRFRFLRPILREGDSLDDPTVLPRYFYSIQDISIGGRCDCNGHADACNIIYPLNDNLRRCGCMRNTCGEHCNYCCPEWRAKKWRPASNGKPFTCEFQQISDQEMEEPRPVSWLF